MQAHTTSTTTASVTTSATTTASSSGARSATGPSAPGRRVIDAPIRMYHWLFALSFAGAWLTAESEHWRAMHVTLGYTLAGLLGFRLVYGLVGPRHARLSVMWRKLSGAPAWLRSLFQPRHAIVWRQGQNLLLAAAVATMLLLVAPLVLSGYAVYDDWGGEWLEDTHELFANTFIATMFVHLSVIALISVLRRRNYARPMLTGRLPEPGPDVVRNNHRPLAVALLLAVLAFGAWQWQESPAGLLGAGDRSSIRHGGHDHEDDD